MKARLVADEEQLVKRYFEWLTDLVDTGEKSRSELYGLLWDTDFYSDVPMDSNRASDGLYLRYRFAKEHGYDRRELDDALKEKPCSVLEMMAALASRCEEHITYDPELGDRTSEWFAEMLGSLGLSDMTDDGFDYAKALYILQRFLNHEYKANGEGGLFTIEHCRYDMRNVEIWYQMMHYLNVTIYGRG